MSVTTAHIPPLLTVPSELLIQIANQLTRPPDVASLLLTNRRLSVLLDHVLDRFVSDLWPESDAVGILPLVQAARHGHMGRAKRLLRLGSNVDTVGRTFSGRPTPSALARAVQHQHTEMIQFLLDNGASIYIGHDGDGGDPLRIAVGEVVKHFLSKPTEAVAPTTDHQSSLLNIIRLLLNQHIVNISNGTIVPPGVIGRWVDAAVTGRGDDMRYLQLLLDYGLPIGDSEGLLMATWKGYAAAADLLLQYGANPRRKWRGVVPLVDIAKKRGHGEVLEVLLKYFPEGVPESNLDEGLLNMVG